MSRNHTTTYRTKKGQYFPLCVKTLLADVMPMELEVNVTKAKINSIMVKATDTVIKPK